MRSLIRVALGLLIATACKADGSSPLAPGEFRILPSTVIESAERRDPELGIVARSGLPLPDHVALAWGVSQLDLELHVELPPGDFDVSARAVEGGLGEADALIRGGLAHYFDFRVRSVTKLRSVFVLRRVGGAPPPVPFEPAAAALTEASAPGRYRGGGKPIAHLVTYLGRFARRPIVDETNLTGNYDVVLQWDPSGGALALRDALLEAGLVLAAAGRPVLTHIVEPQRPAATDSR